MGRELTKALRLVDGTDLPEPLRHTLDAAGALQPVYGTADDARVVVLPEVRVEASDPETRKGLRDLVKDSDAEMTESKPGRFVISVPSGRGDDALTLANRVVEELRPEVAQARFIHVVPRPGPRGREPS